MTGNSVPGIAYRAARLDDAADIHALLLRFAPEIPLLVDTLEREEALYALIGTCARSGESWVALDQANRIVGFILVDPDQFGRHYAEHEILELRYAGVTPDRRNQGIFATLIGKVLARMVPVTTTIGQQNRSGMVRRLERIGFRPTASPGSEQRLRWEPGATGQ
jgi:GNAT superfamily N-acetyltransferase